MTDAVQIDGVPTKQKTQEIERPMKMLYGPDGWSVKIIGSSAPYSVRATPPPAGGGATPAVVAGGAAVPAAVADEVQGFLDFIAKYESRGNYNARFGSAANTDDPNFVTMTIDEVLDWQEGRKFTACGKYQIIRATLEGLKQSLGFSENEVFNKDTQDRMGRKLLKGRGLLAFQSGGKSRDDFALSVAHEWAALPGVKAPHGEKSVYAGDGVNQGHVTVAEYLTAIDNLTA